MKGHILRVSFLLCVLLSQNLNAYLDPGTGSLLLSSIVAIFASFIYFFKNLFYRIVSLSPKSLKLSLTQTGGGVEVIHTQIIFLMPKMR